MPRLKRAMALPEYVILIILVVLALATMNTYLRRAIQARVKDLTDAVISDKQLASLNDPVTEKSVKNITSNSNIQKSEGRGGSSGLSISSSYTVDSTHEVESLDQIDYGQGVPGTSQPPDTLISHEESQE
ncbi:MAG: hypothetical protein ABIE75_02180 [Candidatus Omnitrophota bacterium]